jgi:hypothetical protein
MYAIYLSSLYEILSKNSGGMCGKSAGIPQFIPVIPAYELVRKLQNLLSFPRRRLYENCKTFCHSRGDGNPALVNPVRDDTINILQFIHISTVLTDLINGLDTRLRGYDKSFRTSSEAGIQPW